MKAKDLRNSILQLAVQGKLVPQDPNDEPASVLLDRIRAERARLIKEKKIKAPKGGESVIYRASDGSHYEKRGKGELVCIDEEIPFDIPESWAWVRLGSIAGVLGGKRIPAGRKLSVLPTPQKYIRVSDMQDGSVIIDSLQYVPEDIIPQIAKYTISSNDVYITVAGTIGRVGTVPDELDGANLTENADKLVFRFIDKRWLVAVLNSSWVQKQIADCTTQVGQPKLAIKRIEEFLVPLTPLEEQRRIIHRLEALTDHITDYGILEDSRECLDAELPDKLRKSILQLAVQGKLVEQDPADEPAAALLDRIRAERAALVKAKKLKSPKGGESVIYRASDGGYYEKRGKGEPVCIDDEIPFEIPESWAWARMSTLIELLSGVDLAPSQYNDQHKGIPYLTGASNFDNGRLIENRWTDQPRRISVRGDLLFTCKGTVGAMAINSFEEAHVARQIMAVKPVDAMTLDYIEMFLSSMVENIKSQAKGVIPGIERNTILAALVPMPPINEQQRIVDNAECLLHIFG